MNKAMGAVITAGITALTGVIVIAAFSGGIEGFEMDAQGISDQGCENQREQAAQSQMAGSDPGDEIDNMNERCVPDNRALFEERVSNVAVIQELNQRQDSGNGDSDNGEENGDNDDGENGESNGNDENGEE